MAGILYINHHGFWGELYEGGMEFSTFPWLIPSKIPLEITFFVG
jgi:hypothetical protein